MDEKEKALIEEEARRSVAERGQHGKHGPAMRRYLLAEEQRAASENERDVVPESAPEPPR
ncbi:MULTISPECIES: hypothetical protein [Amycolatopsis]|uniref:Uncharacterized protein n=1 Tax=Amycolatopsis dendrobii TaxID=2760662 RepID=A0A7W3W714_9PSEU|nr:MULTISPECIES: hypothetical protein [Amycolatopsis]MBB1159517.1 hypothetical protein [Amycolatopsis dendrobii]UKD57399.1 hypothetical protein L3Q65_11950 [Amycolatopsis sp. FU40]